LRLRLLVAEVMANNLPQYKLVTRHPQTSHAILEQLVKDPEPKFNRIAQRASIDEP
jgi:UDP-3-O-[3-hydroxymyristoyl] glucosamine N-acyltransferase